METETDTKCECRNVAGHGPMCPANPDPFLCELCGDPYDALEVIRPMACTVPHCATCLPDCRPCTRPHRIV